MFTAKKRAHSLKSDAILHISKVKITHRSQYKNFANSLALLFSLYILFFKFFIGEKIERKISFTALLLVHLNGKFPSFYLEQQL